MNDDRKRHVLEQRLALLRGHIEHVGRSPGAERELARAEDELRAVEERQESPRNAS